MGVSIITALEIYGNQDDIVCECSGQNDDGLFVAIIRRGPGHDGKILLGAELNVKTEEEAVLYMESVRDSVIACIKKELGDEDSEMPKLLADDSVQTALEVARMAKKGIK